MLKKSLRLPASTRLQNAQFFKTPYFSVRIAENNVPTSRFGFIISKKTAKLAVDRNRSKRLVRSCIEELLDTIKPGYDLLFILSKNLSDMRREEIFREVEIVIRSGSLYGKEKRK